MSDFLVRFVAPFVTIFVALDPIGLTPIFITLTDNLSVAQRRLVAIESVITALAVALGFVFVGKWLFGAMGIDEQDFMVAGGAILFAIAALDILTTSRLARHTVPTSVGAVPIGTPLMAGPAVLAASLILVKTHGLWPTLVALVINILLAGVVFSMSGLIIRLLGNAGSKVVSKLVSLILAAFAVMLIRRGIEAMLAGLPEAASLM